ncbi:NADP-dependent 3-hydroxy acid dehydrogenase YdfG [Rhizobium sp. BK077]|uniref:SDR family NAD(P)-dependent oxidoreductase n=1 Tax=unclassified Rhizobium TaxID=2613769 RepID=UPI00180DE48D|nr:MULTISPECIES: SDR family NAD(P)-dependent oxidoreductase [unclassified Rhizobium]MBB3302475.1 NADP-dependent 3-hydroxy acid dehydrogenase YdfG [Rhizobium sp. BK112]MBB3372148.1 NADP-dependent 3-hydroxy acid dehydrogenase YdfG [Rhizobium sp. BK077]MBB4182577.1 NADP-dependent 3-hydroxy acid dehydrogenase YdfG [Rhizobium sp. BK109]
MSGGSNSAQVALSGSRPEPISQLQSEIEAGGGTAIAIACDIADNEAAAQTTITRFGKLDAMFADAGVLGQFKPLAVAEATNSTR